jgi:hypothetical protein
LLPAATEILRFFAQQGPQKCVSDHKHSWRTKSDADPDDSVRE